MAELAPSGGHAGVTVRDWWAVRGEGAFVAGERLPQLEPGPLEMLGLETARPALVAAVAPALADLEARRIRALGSVASSICLVAAGQLDAMVTLRAVRSVDVAAAQLLVRNAAARWSSPAATRSTSRCAHAWRRPARRSWWSGCWARSCPAPDCRPPTRATGRMARLRRVDCSGPGIRRRRRGKGFEYLDEDGRRITEPSVIERIRELAIPPAWEDVWICPYPMGHIQATGTDVAGRKQYRYHDKWRERRDREKFDEMIDFARALPRLRRQVTRSSSCPACRARRCSPAPRGCSTAASSGSARRTMPRRTTPTASPRCASAT